MIIVHISSATTWRGGEQQIAYLLVELSKKNIDQILFCPKNSPLFHFCINHTIPVSTYRRISGVDLLFALKIKLFCSKAIKPIIHVHDSHSHTNAFISSFIWNNKTPIIVHRRVSFTVNRGIFLAFKYRHKSVVRIICVSDYVRQIVDDTLGESGKTITIYDGIDLTRFEWKSGKNLLHTQFHISSKLRLIGNISALTKEKDLFTFIDTAEILLLRHSDIIFIIIGDGPDKQAITEYIKLKKLDNKVLLTGFIENIPYVLQELNLFLFTSVNEGLGTSILDAFACKVPVVSTCAGGIPEIVKNNFTGLTTPIRQPIAMADAVDTILSNSEFRNIIISNAFAFVKDFSIVKTTSEIINIYLQTP